MATLVMPLRRIRIHKQVRLGTWRVSCPCCWSYNGTGLPEPYGTFDAAREWAIAHLAVWHPVVGYWTVGTATGGWTAGPCCTNSICPRCDNGRRNHQ